MMATAPLGARSGCQTNCPGFRALPSSLGLRAAGAPPELLRRLRVLAKAGETRQRGATRYPAPSAKNVTTLRLLCVSCLRIAAFPPITQRVTKPTSVMTGLVPPIHDVRGCTSSTAGHDELISRLPDEPPQRATSRR